MPRQSLVLRTLAHPAVFMIGLMAFAVPAAAATGDLYKVTSEKLNLRTGPSNDARVRSAIDQGGEVVELRRSGNWLGVRVLKTGDEGWVYARLVDRVAESNLGGPPVSQAGFGELAPDFDVLLAEINERLGYEMAAKVAPTGSNGLKVEPTREWSYGLDAKLFAALALYQMWKTYNNGRPVSVQIGAAQDDAITMSDSNEGPILQLPQMVSSR